MFRFGLPGAYLLMGVYIIFIGILSLLFDKLWILLATGCDCRSGLIFLSRRDRFRITVVVFSFFISASFVAMTDYAFNHVLEPHQQQRVDVLLGKPVDKKDADYNVRQARIAIGSGGLWGKGFMKGMLTRYNFVPEQSTDFIFCTIGEEFGFWGTTLLLLIYLALLLRILFIAQRQRSKFSMVYAYGVAAIIFFHILINVGMTIGLMPVIGIPLPFISYGGSSLWSFTLLLFILIKLDGDRFAILR